MEAHETSEPPPGKIPSWKSPDGSFTKTILEPGSGVDKPKECAKCTICIEAVSLPPDQSCYPKGCWFQVELGEGDTSLEHLVDRCLETMLPGEVCQVDGALGFGLILKMAGFENGKETWELGTEEKIRRAMRDREKGGKAYRDGNIEGAERRYSRGLRLLVCTPGEAETERVALLANMAACDLKMGRLREAEERCTLALEKEPGHLKAFYRRGVARAGMADWKGAKGDFETLLTLDPGNKEARRELLRVRERDRQEQAQIRKALGKMFL
ncbi:FK506-binding protein-like [Spea bombifrons]|uniref:FK506-binding protein-like n=1 Tax=Spea bombifrons TaxID=233779 RepID=UPI002349D9C3|nr:FK506-binding protein-like [Spea bombifrons]